MASNKEIVGKLHEYYEARDKLKEIRKDLTRIAVECGQPQVDAANGRFSEFLDGYLAGAGVLPVARIKADRDEA